MLTGSGFTNVGAVQIDDSPMRSFTIDSDTQITVLTSATTGFDRPVGDVRVFDFLTATALPPEFANLNVDPNSAQMLALTGPFVPGTPVTSYVTSPTAPRITALTPNQGPT